MWTQITYLALNMALVPSSLFGCSFAAVAMRYDLHESRRVRLLLAALALALVATYVIAFARAILVVLPNICDDPSTPAWLWWTSGCWVYACVARVAGAL